MRMVLVLKIASPRAIDARRLLTVLPDSPAQAANIVIALGLNAVPNGLPPCESLMPKNVCCVRSACGPPVAPARFSAPTTLSLSCATTRFIWKSTIAARWAAVRSTAPCACPRVASFACVSMLVRTGASAWNAWMPLPSTSFGLAGTGLTVASRPSHMTAAMKRVFADSSGRR